jgi:hypothetical protein
MALSWSARRKSLYTAVGVVLALGVAWWGYEAFFTAAPTCFDQKMDGDEHGVDCGGNSCSLLCRSESHAPQVAWSRVFKTSDNTYTAAAYVQNLNPGAGVKGVQYSFQLFDADNQLIIERRGTVDLSPVQTIPVIEPNIYITNETPARAFFSFSAVPDWYRVSPSAVPKLTIGSQFLSADGSRLSAKLSNGSFADARNVVVAAVLFDASGTAIAASKSTLTVPKKSSAPVEFTFPGGVSGVVRAEITVLPPF